jgi:hypothetical protein
VAGSAADRKRTRQAKASAPGRSRRRSPKDAGAGSGRRGGGRSRAPIGASRCEAGFHETSHGGNEGLFGAWKTGRTGEGRGNRPAVRAGRETARASAPAATRTGFIEEASASSGGLRDGGKAFGRRRDPKRDFERLRPREVPREAGRLRGPHQGTTLIGPSAQRFSKGRPERFRPRCEPWRRHGFGRAGSTREAAAGFRSRSSDPTGIGEGLSSLSAETHRGPNGASRPRCGIRGKRPGLTPRRDPEAAQREMASPPSDGSQGWDKWGPVATPAPIMIRPKRDLCRRPGAGRGFCPFAQPSFFKGLEIGA